jgi:hypothetical protein
MKNYKGEITLAKNARGCYILDTIKGCSVCRKDKPKGCYDNCYAKNIADRYGFDFSAVTPRRFIEDTGQLYMFGFSNSKHENDVVKKIRAIDMPFVRIGEMGDPSENWEHTINICESISRAGKPIVIITKHWNPIPDNLLTTLERLNVCINTSVSALDSEEELEHRLTEYGRLKNVCKSVLRVVSCEFNKGHTDGLDKHIIQEELFKMGKCIDTVFRPSNNNPLVEKGIIKVRKVKFLKSQVLASVANENTYFGDCKNCPDMCGVNL